MTGGPGLATLCSISELHLPLYLVALGAIVTLVAADLLIIRRGTSRL